MELHLAFIAIPQYPLSTVSTFAQQLGPQIKDLGVTKLGDFTGAGAPRESMKNASFFAQVREMSVN